MNAQLAFASENGWFQLLLRLTRAGWRRTRDGFTNRKLRTSGFRVGASPLLLGLGHMRIGAHFHAGDNLWLDAITSFQGQTLDPLLTIGEHVSASDSVHIACAASISIGPGTLLGSRVLITDHAHGVYRGAGQTSPGILPVERPLHSPAPVLIGANVWIGDGVVVLPGAVIGDGAIIGANSVVTGLIPERTIAVGAPARPVREWVRARGEWLPFGETY